MRILQVAEPLAAINRSSAARNRISVKEMIKLVMKLVVTTHLS